MTRQPVNDLSTCLWRVNDTFFTKLAKRVGTSTRIAKPSIRAFTLTWSEIGMQILVKSNSHLASYISKKISEQKHFFLLYYSLFSQLYFLTNNKKIIEKE